MQCELFQSNCPVDPVRIWSVEYPELLAAPKKRGLCPQLDQLYPQLDEPAIQKIHLQALNFKMLLRMTIKLKFSNAEIQKRYSQLLFLEQSMDDYKFFETSYNAKNTLRMK